MISWHSTHKFPNIKINTTSLYALVISSFISRVAMILVGVFSSVYIFQITQNQGFSFVGSISILILFFLTHFVAKAIFLFWAEDLSQVHGFKAVIRYSSIPFILFLFFIYLGMNSLPLLFLAAASWGAEAGLYWWGYHGLFSKLAHDGHFAASISKADVAFTIGGLVTPVVGALIIDNYGFGLLMLVSAILMIISVFFLGIDHDIKQKHDVKIADVKKSFSQNKSLLALFASRGSVLQLHGIIWPLYIFLVLGSILDLGLIISVSTLMSALLMVYVGKYIDKHGERKVLSFASVIITASWILRIGFQGILNFLAIDVTNGLGLRMYMASMDEIAYNRAKKTSTGEALLMRESGLIIGAISILSISGIAIALTGSIVSSFVVAIFFALIPLFIKIKK